ncbi:sensor histidine kinase [Methanosarcina horonobensis]|nr:sensor histidine kinase [Methanosarcina horonobensis]
MSIALIHKELHQGGRDDALNFSLYLEKLAKNLFQTYRVGDTDISLNLNIEDDIFFDTDIAVPLGMTVNELISNSLKYAFKGRDKGKIQIKLFKKKDSSKLSSREEESARRSARYALIISDNGSGIPETVNLEDPGTLGLQLVNSLVDQLDGKIQLKRNGGTKFTINFSATENNR